MPIPGAGDSLQEFAWSLLDSARDGIMLFDERGLVAGINAAAIELSGYASEELIGRSFEVLPLFPIRVLADFEPHFGSTLRDLEVPPFRAAICTKSGIVVRVEIHLKPWKCGQQILGVLATIREIGSVGGLLSATSSGVREDRFRALVETTNDIIWEFDPRAVYTYVSPQVHKTLGYTPEEVLGKTPFDFVALSEARRLTSIVMAAINASQPIKAMEIPHLHQNGAVIHLETSGLPFHDRSGTLAGYRGIHRDVSHRKAADRQVQLTIRKLESTVESVIEAISLTVEMRDQYTAGHQKRVNQLACAIAREMDLPADRIQVIRVAGLLHDFGKMFVPTEILIKPGKLNDLERNLIMSHPRSGYDILKNIEFPWPIADIVMQHHERIDGSGYPAHLRGDEISPDARILSVADVVEAMTFHRSYRPALGLDAALREIGQHKSSLYDPQVVDACIDTFLDQGFKWDNI